MGKLNLSVREMMTRMRSHYCFVRRLMSVGQQLNLNTMHLRKHQAREGGFQPSIYAAIVTPILILQTISMFRGTYSFR